MRKTKKAIVAMLLSVLMVLTVVVPAFAASAKTTKPYENSEFFTVGDYTLHYRQFKAKNPKGQIMMIHGFALSSYCYVELAERLQKKGYTCVLVDQPDFGYSSRETKDTKIMEREDLVYALMKHLSSKPWYVSGHSMGGYIALAVAQKYPKSVKNLLLYSTCGYEGSEGLRQALMTNEAYLNFAGPVLEKAGTVDPLILLLYWVACMDFEYAYNYDRSQIEDPYKIEGTGSAALRAFNYLPKTDYAKVKKMNPILFLYGDEDFVIQESQRKQLRESLPKGSKEVIIKGAGHMVIETHADQVAKKTLSFLKANK